MIANMQLQWLSDSSRVHQIRFRPGLRPGPRWGSLRRFPRPPIVGWGGETFSPFATPSMPSASRHSTPSVSRIRRLGVGVFVPPLSKVWLRHWTHPCYFFCIRPCCSKFIGKNLAKMNGHQTCRTLTLLIITSGELCLNTTIYSSQAKEQPLTDG